MKTTAQAGDEAQPSVAVSLLDPASAAYNAVNCEAELADGVMAISVGQLDSLVDFSLSKAGRDAITGGPVAINFRMRITADKDLRTPLLHWVTEGQTEWKSFARIPSRPDGAWHEYRVLASATERVVGLRLGFGATPHEIEIADMRLTSIPLELPSSLERVDAQRVEAHRDGIQVRFDAATRTYEIDDAQTGRSWRSEPLQPEVTVVGLKPESANAFRLELYDHFAKRVLTARTEVDAGRTARFTLESADYSAPLSTARFFPPRFSTDMVDGQITFCDRSCGVLLDQVDTTYASWPLRVYGNTNCLDMPWVGVFDERRSDGLMLLVETPADAEVAFVADAKGRHWPEVRWLASLDTHRYPRTVSLRFTPEGGHVALAHRYRDYLKAEGRFKTLAQKAAEKPAVERLRGAPALWGGRYPTKFIRQMRPLGVTAGVIGNCRDPEVIEWLSNLGYLIGRYDSHTDFVQGPRGFQSDDVDAAAIVPRPGGPPKHGWKKRSGEQMYWRSSAMWDLAESSYTPQDLAERPYNSRFIDVAGAADLMEDYHPDHTIDRREDLANRRALFAKMNSYGLVLGTEHGNDWVTDQVEYFEGSMSGPFWWSSWPAGYLDRPNREQLSPQYMKYGMGYEHRVPLWELVYHDCVNTTWYWGDTAGLLYDAAPELSDRKDLFNILYGTLPLFWMKGTGYRHPEETHRMLRSYHDTCQLHHVVGFEQLTSHEFLSDDRAVQRTRFANGTIVVVNFADDEREYITKDRAVALAPRGFYAVGPGFEQSRLATPYGPETVVRRDGYLAVASNGELPVRGVQSDGRLTALRVGKKRWNVFTDPNTTWELNIAEVTGWPATDTLRLGYMDDVGEIHRPIAEADATGVVRFRSTENAWRFVVLREPAGAAE